MLGFLYTYTHWIDNSVSCCTPNQTWNTLLSYTRSEHLSHLSLTRVSRKCLHYEMSQSNWAGTDWPLPRCTPPQLLIFSGKHILMKHIPGLSLDIVTGQTMLPKFHKAHFITGNISVDAFLDSCTLRGFRQHLKWLHNYTAINENYTLVRHCWKSLISLYCP